MRILVFGGTGLAGREVAAALGVLGEVSAPGRNEVDLGRPDLVEEAVRARRPDLIVNASAQADVDRAEREPEAAHAVNCASVAAMGRAAATLGAPLVHLSTDYVFDGEKGDFYVETDATRPLSHYGTTKRDGEEALLATGAHAVVLRTAWLIGRSPRSFVMRMLELARSRETLQVADDQSSSPTPVPELVRVVVSVSERLVAAAASERDRLRGVYHAAGAGRATRIELVQAALELVPDRASLRAREVVPVPGDHFPRGAPRPRHTPLSNEKLRRMFDIVMPPWRDGLARALSRYAESEGD